MASVTATFSIGYARRGNRENAIERLEQRVRENGTPARLRTVAIESDRPFPHLKLIAVDGERAYIGSANLTWPALTSNAEIEALVEGEPVSVLERWFDALTATPTLAVPTASAERQPQGESSAPRARPEPHAN